MTKETMNKVITIGGTLLSGYTMYDQMRKGEQIKDMPVLAAATGVGALHVLDNELLGDKIAIDNKPIVEVGIAASQAIAMYMLHAQGKCNKYAFYVSAGIAAWAIYNYFIASKSTVKDDAKNDDSKPELDIKPAEKAGE